MRYLLAIAVSLAGAMFPFTLWAQSFHPRIGPQGVGPFYQNDSGFRPLLGGFQPGMLPPFFGYPSNYPFAYFYPGLWPPIDVEYQQASRIAHGNVAAEVADQKKDLLSSQVQALTEEQHSLRQSRASSPYEQAPAVSPRAELRPQTAFRPQAGAEQKFPATVFIYRDGHEMEVRDYAIFGKTLWVFRGGTSRKFPLADFNLEASRQVNEEHGVEFPLSGQRSQ